jgi:glycosyltransferase involved in cell wall biosynthesis
MRVLRVAQKVYPDVVGGGPYHVHAMSRDQAAMGHDVTVLTVDHGDGTAGHRPHVESRNGYTVVRYPARAAPLGNAVAPGIGQFLRDAPAYDVVHAHSHLYFATNLAALQRRLGDTPLAITNHGLYSQNAPRWAFDLYLRTLGRWTFDAADAVFCYTDADRDRLRERGVSTRIEVVPNGIDTTRFTPDGPTHEEVKGNPAILFVGRLVEGKRPTDALAAVARLREEYPDAMLTVCGEGPLRSTLGKQAREHDMESALEFLGHVDYEAMPSVYRAADALVLPSRAEGFPRTVLEAMATGTPVVVSDLPGIGPVVDGDHEGATVGGETVAVGDVAGFAAALGRVLEGSYHPADVITERYDWADTVERTTAVLESLAGAPADSDGTTGDPA